MDTVAPLTPSPPSQLRAVRTKPGKRNSLRQVVDLQNRAYAVACRLSEDCLSPNLDVERRAKSATAMGNLIKAWDSAEDRKRIIRGKPLPGSLRPEKAKPKKGPATFATPEE